MSINAAIVAFESKVDNLKYRYRQKIVDPYRYEENAYIGTDTDPIIGGSLKECISCSLNLVW